MTSSAAFAGNASPLITSRARLCKRCRERSPKVSAKFQTCRSGATDTFEKFQRCRELPEVRRKVQTVS